MDETRWLESAQCDLSSARLQPLRSRLPRCGHRFLAINVLAGRAGTYENFAVLVVGNCDKDGIHIFTIEDLFIIACRRNILFDRFLRCRVSRIVVVAHSKPLGTWHVQRFLEQLASLHAHAYRGEAHGVARRNGASRCPERLRLQEINSAAAPATTAPVQMCMNCSFMRFLLSRAGTWHGCKFRRDWPRRAVFKSRHNYF